MKEVKNDAVPDNDNDAELVLLIVTVNNIFFLLIKNDAVTDNDIDARVHTFKFGFRVFILIYNLTYASLS